MQHQQRTSDIQPQRLDFYRQTRTESRRPEYVDEDFEAVPVQRPIEKKRSSLVQDVQSSLIPVMCQSQGPTT